MRMKLTTDDQKYVFLSYDEQGWDDTYRESRTFMCPPDGGYVRELRGDDWKQVCDRLWSMGSTLSCESRDKLPDLIRREYRAMRRAKAINRNY